MLLLLVISFTATTAEMDATTAAAADIDAAEMAAEMAAADIDAAADIADAGSFAAEMDAEMDAEMYAADIDEAAAVAAADF
jgi:hypothetical protein